MVGRVAEIGERTIVLIPLNVETPSRISSKVDRSHSDIGHERVSRYARVNDVMKQKYGRPLSNLKGKDYHTVTRIYFTYYTVKMSKLN